MNLSRSTRCFVLGLITLLAAIVTVCLPRISQDPAYHQFADQRKLLGLPNACDVLSNLPFVPVGIWGLWLLCRRKRIQWGDKSERLPFFVFFGGAVLIGFGSAWYHLAPDNHRLVWDRLPMTMGFMGLVSALISERVSVRTGVRLLLPLIFLGLGSVVYWSFTEGKGVGDLRPYIFVQFFPMILLPLLLWLFPARYTRGADYLLVFGFYLAAKVLEVCDQPVFEFNGIISGHTLKHLFAAASIAFLLRMLVKRSPISAPEERHELSFAH